MALLDRQIRQIQKQIAGLITLRPDYMPQNISYSRANIEATVFKLCLQHLWRHQDNKPTCSLFSEIFCSISLVSQFVTRNEMLLFWLHSERVDFSIFLSFFGEQNRIQLRRINLQIDLLDQALITVLQNGGQKNKKLSKQLLFYAFSCLAPYLPISLSAPYIF